MATRNREQILARAAAVVTGVGMALPIAYAASVGLSQASNYLGSLDVVGWLLDWAMILSLPWEIIATLVVILRWRDLPQRFWILYCVNGVLTYISLPIYRMHFGLYR